MASSPPPLPPPLRWADRTAGSCPDRLVGKRPPLLAGGRNEVEVSQVHEHVSNNRIVLFAGLSCIYVSRVRDTTV